MKLIPALDILGGKCVQLIGGDPAKKQFEIDTLEQVKKFESEGAEALWIVDLDATLGSGDNSSLIKRLIEQTNLPVFVAGGIRTAERGKELLDIGVDKIVIGTKAVQDPDFLKNFPRSKLVAALDCKNGKICIKGWQEETELTFRDVSEKLNDIVSLYLVTNVDVEGRFEGPDFEFIQQTLSALKKPVIISGGISTQKDLEKIADLGAYACVVGTALYKGEVKLQKNLLAKRIIPCLDVLDGRVVKGIKFQIQKYRGDPVERAREYYEQGADELVLLDIGASPESRDIMVDVVKKVAEQIFIPFTVGGGIRSIEDMRKILLAGADKVSINTAAVKNPNIVKESSEKFGSQCIVVAIDARRKDSSWDVLIKGGREPVNLDAIEWAKKVEKLGAGEILLTSFDADGTKSGYDLELNQAISENVNIPVIASGGAGTLESIYDALRVADAALAASIFHFGEYTVGDVKKYLKEKGVVVR